MSYFNQNLKYLREQKKISQKKLAEMANVNQTTILRWEAGEMSPSLDNIYDVSQALNVSVADLTGKDLTKCDYDELSNLFSMNRDKLSISDETIIKTIIEQRIRELSENERKL